MPTIDYCFSVASPWSYLGSERFIALARRHGATVNVLPLDYTRVFAASGGKLYQDRAPQRIAYRQVELARWRRKLGIPLMLEPRFYPCDRRPSSCLLIAARERGDDALALSHAVLRAIWSEDRDIADWGTLEAIADEAGLPGAELVALACEPAANQRYEADTDRAIAAGVFGAPTYVVESELFWGQDRLEFLEDRLAGDG